MIDAFTPETVIRLWLLGACLATATVLSGALLVSHAAEKAFRDAAQRNHPVQPDLRPMLPSTGGAGFEAHRQGVDIADCPHPEGSDERSRWAGGWSRSHDAAAAHATEWVAGLTKPGNGAAGAHA